MSDITYNPPPLPEPAGIIEFSADIGWTETQVRQIEAAAFARGVAAGQEAMQEEIARLKLQLDAEMRHSEILRAKLQALEEQKPFAWIDEDGLRKIRNNFNALISPNRSILDEIPVYLAAGAKYD